MGGWSGGDSSRGRELSERERAHRYAAAGRASGGLYRGLCGALPGVCRWVGGVAAGRAKPLAGDAAGDCGWGARDAVYRARHREQPRGKLGGVLGLGTAGEAVVVSHAFTLKRGMDGAPINAGEMR